MTEEFTATQIIKRLQEAGHITVFAGGCVRDKVMGRMPKDFDIATSATPDQVEALFSHTIPVGKSFGVIVVIENGMQFEVATLRNDSKNSDGRRPESVAFTKSLREDAKRRDFTMNAMFFDPVTEELLDFFGGMFDLEDNLIACVGEPRLRFEEDKLRMMRAIRFACTLGFDIEEYTFNAIRENADKINEVSMERIKMELDKILLSDKPSIGIKLLKRCGLLPIILPEVNDTILTEQSPKFHSEGNVFKHSMMVLDATRKSTNNLNALWAALLHDIGKFHCSKVEEDGTISAHGHESIGAEMAERIMKQFKSSSDHTDMVVAIVRDHMKIKAADKMKKFKLRRFMAMEHFEDLLLVSSADSLSSIPADSNDLVGRLDWLERVLDIKSEFDNEVKLPDPFITGKDLIELGFTPGPIFGKIKSDMMDLQLSGEVNTKEEALKVLKDKI